MVTMYKISSFMPPPDLFGTVSIFQTSTWRPEILDVAFRCNFLYHQESDMMTQW